MKQKLSLTERLLIGTTLFGLFFGAGNLIFPVHLGQIAGYNVWPAIIGFILTGVTIPILGVAAIGNTNSTGLFDLSKKAGKPFGYVFTVLLYLTIGPFFAIPRCCTTSFTVGIDPLNLGNDTLVLAVYSIVFFALVLFFSLRPSNIVTWVGKIMAPLFLVFLSILTITALTHSPTAISRVLPSSGYDTQAFFKGIIEGYGTMDGIAALAFGVIIINSINAFGIKDEKIVAKETVKSGIVAGVLMAVIYIAITIMGTESCGAFKPSENGGIALVQIANYYLDDLGGIILACTMTFACLKTAIGLVTSCAETFVYLFPKTFSYKGWAIVFTLFSCGVSNVGLTAIINYSIPVLMLLYPPTIVLTVLALCDKLFKGKKCVYVCTLGGSLIAAFVDFVKTLPFGIDVSAIERFLPFSGLGMGWVVPSAIGAIIGIVVAKLQKD